MNVVWRKSALDSLLQLDKWRESIELESIKEYLMSTVDLYFQKRDFSIYIPGRQVLIRQMPGGIRMVLIAIGNSGPYKVFYRATGENVDKALPQCVITLSAPHKTTLFLGFQKKYSKIALRLDDPVYFRNYLNNERGVYDCP